jgi:hypothetical protein
MAREKFGLLLLEPSATGSSLEAYSDYLWDVGDIACELLGKLACIKPINELGRLGSAPLRESACRFLQFELQVAPNNVYCR